MCSASWNVFWYRIHQSSLQLSEQLYEREFARLHRDKCNLRLFMLVCCRTLMINVGAVWSVYVLCACLVVCLVCSKSCCLGLMQSLPVGGSGISEWRDCRA